MVTAMRQIQGGNKGDVWAIFSPPRCCIVFLVFLRLALFLGSVLCTPCSHAGQRVSFQHVKHSPASPH